MNTVLKDWCKECTHFKKCENCCAEIHEDLTSSKPSNYFPDLNQTFTTDEDCIFYDMHSIQFEDFSQWVVHDWENIVEFTLIKTPSNKQLMEIYKNNFYLSEITQKEDEMYFTFKRKKENKK